MFKVSGLGGLKNLRFFKVFGSEGLLRVSWGGPGGKPAKTSKLKPRKREEDPWGAGGKSGEIRRVLEP